MARLFDYENITAGSRGGRPGGGCGGLLFFPVFAGVICAAGSRCSPLRQPAGAHEFEARPGSD